jgi:hypothetical protein
MAKFVIVAALAFFAFARQSFAMPHGANSLLARDDPCAKVAASESCLDCPNGYGGCVNHGEAVLCTCNSPCESAKCLAAF